MIGLFGIIAHEAVLKTFEREKHFSLMMHGIDTNDFHNTSVNSAHFSIGLTRRNIGENKDLALKLIRDDFGVGFCGYGKFRGETKLCWPEEMIDRIVPLYQDQGEDILTQIEGSFVCLLVQNKKFIIIGDRFSSKNLFYFQSDKTFVFAPDVGRVIESGLVPREKDLDAAKQVLVSNFFLGDSTLARGIKKFPYANLFQGVISAPIKVIKERYWEVPQVDGTVNNITPGLLCEFEAKIKRAIYELADLESRAIVPLSGGLDSRAIAYYLSKRQTLETVTYDLGKEVSFSKKVCKALNGSQIYFSNEMLCSDDFKHNLKQMVQDQRIHCVVEQYFYAPLFKSYFREHTDRAALFDGVYMDSLFNTAYRFHPFEFEDYMRVYGRGVDVCSSFGKNLKRDDLVNVIRRSYERIRDSIPGADSVGRSQKAYHIGRLRRYVLEAAASRENYCYVFKPGFDYDLMDFGLRLSLRVRKGLLYQELFKTLTEVKNIPFKDSYGIRVKTFPEKVKNKYVSLRLKLSYGTNGLLPYFTYQPDWFFLGEKEIDDYRDNFLRPNHIRELIDDTELESLFRKVKRKHYYVNLFQRILFVQQFYDHYRF